MPLFERQYLTGSFYLYHSFSVIAALPLSSTLCVQTKQKGIEMLAKQQKKIIIIGAILLIVCCLFPPWIYTFKASGMYSEESAGYSLFINPPAKKSKNPRFGVKLDTSRLLLQFFMISISTGLGVFISQNKQQKEDN